MILEAGRAGVRGAWKAQIQHQSASALRGFGRVAPTWSSPDQENGTAPLTGIGRVISRGRRSGACGSNEGDWKRGADVIRCRRLRLALQIP